ncbi:Ovostatin [Lonchura striata]|uniref:Ovostatin n=1 Tax=Lonchura striata TaxID=40157 RepID=A0A218ULW5_9PASE|nr:Ovostatin [Lonchura striata domestica]
MAEFCDWSYSQYVLLVPSVVRSDAPQTACVQLHNLSEPLSMSIVLEYGSVQRTLFEEPVTENDFFKCSEFQVPPATSDPLAFISFSARGATVDLAERRSVAIQNVDGAVFVQTDKPLYKPGQTGSWVLIYQPPLLDFHFDDCFFSPFIPSSSIPESSLRFCCISFFQDPDQNKIFQWLEVTSNHGIVQLSFPLIPEPILGSYRITVETKSGEKEYQSFRVEEYVLPKFEVTTTGPKTISFFDEEVRVNVCASYTYGQPVQGNAQINVCQQRFYSPLCVQNREKTCEAVTGLLGKDGCLNSVISIKKFQLYRSYARMYASLNIESIVTENGTGIQMKTYDYVSVNQGNDQVQFRNIDSYYKRGIPYHGEITVTNMDGEPVASSTVLLELNGDYLANYTTDKNGVAAFSIDTSNFFDPSLKLTVKQAPDECADFFWRIHNEPKDSFIVRRFYSRTNSFLKIEPVTEQLSCGQQRTVNVHYVLNREGYRNLTYTNFYYIVMTQGKIVLSGQKEVSISGDSRGTFPITLTVTEKLGPNAKLLLYTVHPEGEIVADSSSIHGDICFKNKVQLKFSEKQGRPGSEVGLHLEAAANSYCALRAIQSVLLHSGQELTAESVYYQLGRGDLYGYYYNGLSLEDDRPQACTPSKTIFSDGLYFEPVNVSRDGDVYGIFRDMGLKVFTNSVLRKPVLCNEERSDTENFLLHHYDANLKATDESRIGGGSAGFSSVRKYFPETWIWELVNTDSRGEVDVSYTIPDSITEWKASAFCVQDDAGFGMSSPVSLTAFQPFFVDLTLPYSVTRGERFNLIANVFNYLNECVQISTILAESSDYEAEILSSGGNTATVCANERKTYIWAVSPQKLGEVKFEITAGAKLNTGSIGNSTSPEDETIYRDTLFQTLLVEDLGQEREPWTKGYSSETRVRQSTRVHALDSHIHMLSYTAKCHGFIVMFCTFLSLPDHFTAIKQPEGIKKELTQSSLVCAKGKKISEQVSLSLPRNVVQGSARAYFSVIGDILGTALRNMDNLLHMPYGCGEQNMALFTPNIYALDYLNKTGQLTEEIKVRGTGYLSRGYQRQLSYKHRDGSYSSFGSRDEEGSV